MLAFDVSFILLDNKQCTWVHALAKLVFVNQFSTGKSKIKLYSVLNKSFLTLPLITR